MLFFHSQDDIWDIYAPLNGLSRREELALKPFEYASGSHHHRVTFSFFFFVLEMNLDANFGEP